MKEKTFGSLAVFLILAFIVSLFLGYRGLKKIEKSYAQALNKEKTSQDNLSQEKNSLNDKIIALEGDNSKLKEDDFKNKKMIEELLKQSQENLVLVEQIQLLNEKMQKSVELCEINPKEVKKEVKAVARVKRHYRPQPVDKKVVENPKTIVINKIYIKDSNSGNQKLIKEEKKVINKKYYPNDFLK